MVPPPAQAEETRSIPIAIHVNQPNGMMGTMPCRGGDQGGSLRQTCLMPPGAMPPYWRTKTSLSMCIG